ncbi:hypothetical protein M426DRAFT_325832 [Hypoxylon sp. CI-4A]|nr:hypothetical protein M426DRAFT_325832 [Hypoxylon sp. CI-4A]
MWDNLPTRAKIRNRTMMQFTQLSRISVLELAASLLFTHPHIPHSITYTTLPTYLNLQYCPQAIPHPPYRGLPLSLSPAPM